MPRTMNRQTERTDAREAQVVRTRRGNLRLGIVAPASVKILRAELLGRESERAKRLAAEATQRVALEAAAAAEAATIER